MPKVDVVIPVYKPTEYILSLFLGLSRQTVKPNRVYVINTEKKCWDRFFEEYDICKKYPFLEVIHIKKEEFDHGNTRNMGVRMSDAPFVLLMTDDAIPADEHLIERLLLGMKDPKIGMCYARQKPHKGARVIEKYTRSFNYPAQPVTKGYDDLQTMGIKTFFASNVCCMYRRKIFDDLGGFVEHTNFNEDMIYARKLIENGYLIRYEASAAVRHSHNYTGIQYLRRNYEMGRSQADHPEVFGDVKSEGEGIKMVKSTAVYLCKHFMPHLVFKLIWHSGCKYAGYFFGKRYTKIPQGINRIITGSSQNEHN